MEHYDLTPIRKYWRRIINFFLEFYYILSLKKKNNNNNNKNLQFNSFIESQGTPGNGIRRKFNFFTYRSTKPL